MLPRPMTSMIPSGPTTPAVSSSTPRPSSDGFWAIRLSSRPRRFRCWKCWSTITPGSIPSPAAIWAIRCFGVAPEAPNAIMWLHIAEAPARRAGHHGPVPEPLEHRVGQPRAADVEASLSWLPPVRKTPVASRSASGERGSSLACGRVVAWSGRTVLTPRSREDLAVPLARLESRGSTRSRSRRSSRPGRRRGSTKRLRMTRSRILSSAPPMMMTVRRSLNGHRLRVRVRIAWPEL